MVLSKQKKNIWKQGKYFRKVIFVNAVFVFKIFWVSIIILIILVHIRYLWLLFYALYVQSNKMFIFPHLNMFKAQYIICASNEYPMIWMIPN